MSLCGRGPCSLRRTVLPLTYWVRRPRRLWVIHRAAKTHRAASPETHVLDFAAYPSDLIAGEPENSGSCRDLDERIEDFDPQSGFLFITWAVDTKQLSLKISPNPHPLQREFQMKDLYDDELFLD